MGIGKEKERNASPRAKGVRVYELFHKVSICVCSCGREIFTRRPWLILVSDPRPMSTVVHHTSTKLQRDPWPSSQCCSSVHCLRPLDAESNSAWMLLVDAAVRRLVMLHCSEPLMSMPIVLPPKRYRSPASFPVHGPSERVEARRERCRLVV